MKWMEWGGVQRTQFKERGEGQQMTDDAVKYAVNEAFLDVWCPEGWMLSE